MPLYCVKQYFVLRPSKRTHQMAIKQNKNSLNQLQRPCSLTHRIFCSTWQFACYFSITQLFKIFQQDCVFFRFPKLPAFSHILFGILGLKCCHSSSMNIICHKIQGMTPKFTQCILNLFKSERFNIILKASINMAPSVCSPFKRATP